jgi:hypothetical protein
VSPGVNKTRKVASVKLKVRLIENDMSPDRIQQDFREYDNLKPRALENSALSDQSQVKCNTLIYAGSFVVFSLVDLENCV